MGQPEIGPGAPASGPVALARMTPDALRRLLGDLPAPANAHALDAGVLGEYALVERERGPAGAAEAYPRVAAHLRPGCQRCQDDLVALKALARRMREPRGQVPAPRPARGSAPHSPRATTAPRGSAAHPEPLEISEAVTLARAIEAEREALRAPLQPDRTGQVDSRRQSNRQRQILLVEAALIRQRLVARGLFLKRAQAMLAPGPRSAGDAPHPPAPSLPYRVPPDSTTAVQPSEPDRPGGSSISTSPQRDGPTVVARGRGSPRGHVPGDGPGRDGRPGARVPNPKAHLLLDDFAGSINELSRLARRLGRLTADVRRLGDDPHGPARSQSEALTNRGLALTRESLRVDHRLARLQGILAGMLT